MATTFRKPQAPARTPKALATSSPWPLVIHTRPALDLTENQFLALCQLNRDFQIERTAAGDWSIMPPVAASSGRGEADIVAVLWAWAKRDGTGTVFSASTGFRLPNGAVRARDASWVLNSRLERFSAREWEQFLPLCPDFVLELRSPSDRLADLQKKMREYIPNGARLGWLLDPRRRRVYVYRPHAAMERLDHPDKVSATQCCPGSSWTCMRFGSHSAWGILGLVAATVEGTQLVGGEIAAWLPTLGRGGACNTCCAILLHSSQGMRRGAAMSEPAHSTQIMTASEAHNEWSQVLDRVACQQARVLVEKDGVPVAAIVSAEDLDLLTKLDAERQDPFAEIEAIRAKNAEIDPETVERDVAAAIAALRAARRASR